jgi:hypothetical protein
MREHLFQKNVLLTFDRNEIELEVRYSFI